LAVRSVLRDDTGLPVSFDEFYRVSYQPALRLATFLVGVDDAEDVVQDCFEALHQRFALLEHPDAYLRTTVANRCRALHHSSIRRDRRQQLAAKPELLDAEHRELLDVLTSLPYDQRAVLVLRLWAGWSDIDIANALGCRPATVRSHARRALTRLRKDLDQ